MEIESKREAVFGLVLFAAMAFLLIPWNLHCSQDASLYIATFDGTPHPEEVADQNPVPAVFGGPAALLLRLVLGVLTLVAYATPAIAIWLVSRWPGHWGLYALAVGGVGALTLLSRLPLSIVGERFHFLFAVGQWLVGVLGLMALVTVFLCRDP